MKRVFAVLLLSAVGLLAQPQTGTIAGTTSVVFDSIGSTMATLTIQITGTFTAQLQFEATVNNVTWNPIAVVPPGTTGVRVTYVTAAGMWQANVAGYLKARVRATSWTSGTITVTGRLSSGPAPFGAVAAVSERELHLFTVAARIGGSTAAAFSDRGRDVDRARRGWRGLTRV